MIEQLYPFLLLGAFTIAIFLMGEFVIRRSMRKHPPKR